MVLLKPHVIMGAMNPAMPRSQVSAYGIQLVSAGKMTWAKRAAFFRNQPYTAVAPHLGQVEVRIAFGEAASKAEGKTGLAPDGLPWAAHYVREELTGYRAPDAMDPEDYPSKKKRTFRTLEDLYSLRERLERARGRRAPARRGRGRRRATETE